MAVPPTQTAERETLLLIDGHALVFRAFFAMPALTNSRGEMTNAVYGFTSMLLKVLGEHTPTYVIGCFDPPGPTFRHEEFADYKAQRPSAPDEIRRQLPLCRDVCTALGIPLVELPGYEADDVIGTLSCRAVEQGLDVLILTGDLDTLQLVNQHVRVYATRRGITETIVYDTERVRERFGFEPPLVADFKALQGDVSDNIPGVPGIGEKTAMSLVQEHGTVEKILAAAPAMKEGRVKRTLLEHADQAMHSKRMTTVVLDLDVPLDLEAARFGGYDHAQVVELFDRLEFRSLLPRLPQYGTPVAAPPPVVAAPSRTEVHVLADLAAVTAAVTRLRGAGGGVAVRTVLDEPARLGRIAGVALSPLDDPSIAYYAPLAHPGDGSLESGGIEQLAALIADRSVAKTAYDVKREVLAWRGRGGDAAGFDFDCLLAAYLCNTRTRVPPLTILAEETAATELAAEETVLGTGRAARLPSQLDIAEAAEYYGRWTALLAPVREALESQLASWGVHSLHDDMELPLVPILADMELRGIAVDSTQLHRLAREISDRVAAIEAEVQDAAGYTFNLGSTQQLARFLYDDLGLATGRRTKTGRSTDADSLEALREENPIVDLILEWRQLTKLKGTYVDALPLLCDSQGRVHTSFNQAVATTGRLSSADPNLQNVPIRSEVGQRIRAAFVADRGHQLVSADYSQIELRVLAHVTNDPALVDAFRSGEDIHARTAAEVCRVDRAAVTREMRRNAKVVNFGIVYGLSDFGLARDTGMSREEARAFIDAYFATFASVTAYLEQTRNHAREWGYVETLFGRRRYIPDIRAANRQIRGAAERMAVNMPMQGTAADIMKLAMIRVDRALRESGLRARLLLQVHDELVLEAPEAEVVQLSGLLREAMGSAAQLIVPLDVDVKIGSNWSAVTAVAETAPVAS
ncbi:MAG: DNA polymerase I [Chloroflexi bacterium]|nr:MAG: DNA polymerase I [Chloroflexota bacterium]